MSVLELNIDISEVFLMNDAQFVILSKWKEKKAQLRMNLYLF